VIKYAISIQTGYHKYPKVETVGHDYWPVLTYSGWRKLLSKRAVYQSSPTLQRGNKMAREKRNFKTTSYDYSFVYNDECLCFGTRNLLFPKGQLHKYYFFEK